MLSPEARNQWEERLKAASTRCEAARLRVGESAIERLHLLKPDGYHAHNLALRDETEALKEYRDLLAEYARLMNWLSSDTP